MVTNATRCERCKKPMLMAGVTGCCYTCATGQPRTVMPAPDYARRADWLTQRRAKYQAEIAPNLDPSAAYPQGA